MKVSELEEFGPRDIRQAIRSFNIMQRQVSDSVLQRTRTLAAISHDIRSPLTALRVKAELLEDDSIRADHIKSIEKMERITASALDYLRGESRNEPKRQVDLCALVESECVEFQEQGEDVEFIQATAITVTCRPEALTRALVNLIDNAVKYADGGTVSIAQCESWIDLSVSDNGPGISSSDYDRVIEPFERLSAARESDKNGFGLGLAISKAIAEGHEGKLLLQENTPHGLIAVIRLPRH